MYDCGDASGGATNAILVVSIPVDEMHVSIRQRRLQGIIIRRKVDVPLLEASVFSVAAALATLLKD